MIEKLKSSYSGKIAEVEFGKGKIVGGESTLPFYLWEGEMPHLPLFGIEIWDEKPNDWSQVLEKIYSDVWEDPVLWSKKAVELGAEFIQIALKSTDPAGSNSSPDEAAEKVKALSEAAEVPLVVYGSGDKEKDPDVLRKVVEVLKDKALVGPACEENYRLVVAPLVATSHNVVAFSPVDINIAKQLNILITQMDFDAKRIVMDPTTGALGYGLEYTYSIMERLRLAALLQNDQMTQMPIISTVGQEAWRAKEAKVGQEEEPKWGELEKRGIMWELGTAIPLLLAGADLVSLRHPKSLEVLKKIRDEFAQGGSA
jgi:acetyl-CoA decarbonylase/synthase complex subunit delta